MVDIQKIAPFFLGWDETLVWSCLQRCMGYAIADDEEDPSAALITVGDFCFFAGTPNAILAAQATVPVLVPRNEEWGSIIESVWGDRVEKTLRYAIKKEPEIFDIHKLKGYADSIPKDCALKFFDKDIYDFSRSQKWSQDFCAQFSEYDDFSKRGIGVAVIYQGKPVSGASSYTVYNGGIEIEVDTDPTYRQRGFATACCAGLILECLKRGLYPSWDAYDLRSVALAQKLGYHMDHPYTVYVQKQD